MSAALDPTERHNAPEGKNSGATQFILIGTLIVALCFIVYLLMFNKGNSAANATTPEVKQATSQLHTSNSKFEMPVFKAAELPEPVKVVAVEPKPLLTFDPLPVPEPIPVSEIVTAPEPLNTSAKRLSEPAKDKPMTDEERRLGGGVSGNKRVASVTDSAHRSSSKSVYQRDNSSGNSALFQREPSDAFIPSVYEFKEGQVAATKSSYSSEITSSDIDRLDRLATLYGVSDRFTRGDSKRATRHTSVNDDGFESANQPSASRYFESGQTSHTSKQRFEPTNQSSNQRSSNHNNGIDLTSTKAAGVQARRINLDYLLKQGTYISCVLKTRIVSDQAGFISCSVTENIYSANGKHLLVPRGSDVLGEYKPKSLSTGKVRLHAVWDALTTPDGLRVNLGSPSTGALGGAGIGGQVNNHYGQKVGIPILLSLFRTAIDYRTLSFSGESGEYQRTGTDAADDVLSDQIRQYEEVRPTLTKHQGATIGIMVARDVSFESVLTGPR